MGAQNNEINRTVDGDIAEGHVRRFTIEEATDLKAGLKTKLDEADEAEGHAIARKAKLALDDADEAEGHAIARKAKLALDDATEGHAILRSPERPSTDIRHIGRRAKATIDDADEAEGHIRM